MEDLLQSRLEALIRRYHLSRSQAERFANLETVMNTPSGESDKEMLKRFHQSNDEYLPLLERVLRGLTRLGEPGAAAKLDLFLEEFGAVGPAVFLSPWELTLRCLDENQGGVEEIESFYA